MLRPASMILDIWPALENANPRNTNIAIAVNPDGVPGNDPRVSKNPKTGDIPKLPISKMNTTVGTPRETSIKTWAVHHTKAVSALEAKQNTTARHKLSSAERLKNTKVVRIGLPKSARIRKSITSLI